MSKLYNRNPIIAGLIVFSLVFTAPLWWNLAKGAGRRQEPERPATETKCVEGKEYMAARHMQLLYEWRDAVVRDGKNTYTSKAHGDTCEMSLTKTCLRCHTNRDKFCNRCHDYADVHPNCWKCHLDPKGN